MFDGTPAIPWSLEFFIRYALDVELTWDEATINGAADHRGMQLLMTLRLGRWRLAPAQWAELRAMAPHIHRIGTRERHAYAT